MKNAKPAAGFWKKVENGKGQGRSAGLTKSHSSFAHYIGSKAAASTIATSSRKMSSRRKQQKLGDYGSSALTSQHPHPSRLNRPRPGDCQKAKQGAVAELQLIGQGLDIGLRKSAGCGDSQI